MYMAECHSYLGRRGVMAGFLDGLSASCLPTRCLGLLFWIVADGSLNLKHAFQGV